MYSGLLTRFHASHEAMQLSSVAWRRQAALEILACNGSWFLMVSK